MSESIIFAELIRHSAESAYGHESYFLIGQGQARLNGFRHMPVIGALMISVELWGSQKYF